MSDSMNKDDFLFSYELVYHSIIADTKFVKIPKFAAQALRLQSIEVDG